MERYHLDTIEERELIPGFRVRFVHSDTMTIAYWNIDGGSALPEHSHPNEQIVNVMEGELELVVEDRKLELAAGSVVVVPPGVPHAGRALSDCRVIDVFHPTRDDYR